MKYLNRQALVIVFVTVMGGSVWPVQATPYENIRGKGLVFWAETGLAVRWSTKLADQSGTLIGKGHLGGVGSGAVSGFLTADGHVLLGFLGAQLDVLPDAQGNVSGTIVLGGSQTGQVIGTWTVRPPRLPSTWGNSTTSAVANAVSLDPGPFHFTTDMPPPVPHGPSIPAVATQSVHPADFVGDYYQAEPYLAVSPVDPAKLIAVWNDGDHGLWTTSWAASTDEGHTWTNTHPSPVFPGIQETWGSSSDPVVDYDAGGTAYYTTIGIGEECGLDQGLYFARSMDDGQSWERRSDVVTVHGTKQDPVLHPIDKPWLAADKRTSGVIWSAFMLSTGYWNTLLGNGFCYPTSMHIELGYTSDGGATWERYSLPEQYQTTGAQIAVRPDGRAVVVWNQWNANPAPTEPRWGLYSARCTAPPVSCESPKLISSFTYPPYQYPWADENIRLNPFATLAVDNGPGGSGYAAVAWSNWDENTNTLNVNYTAARDGRRWLPVKTLAGSATADETHPALLVDRQHNLHLFYYLMEVDAPQHRLVTPMIINSGDAGASWSAPLAVDVAFPLSPTTVGGGWLGDYMGAASGAPKMHFVWTRLDPNGSGPHAKHIALVGCAVSPAAPFAWVLLLPAGIFWVGRRARLFVGPILLTLVVCGLLFALLLTGCGDDNDHPIITATPTATPTRPRNICDVFPEQCMFKTPPAPTFTPLRSICTVFPESCRGTPQPTNTARPTPTWTPQNICDVFHEQCMTPPQPTWTPMPTPLNLCDLRPEQCPSPPPLTNTAKLSTPTPEVVPDLCRITHTCTTPPPTFTPLR